MVGAEIGQFRFGMGPAVGGRGNHRFIFHLSGTILYRNTILSTGWCRPKNRLKSAEMAKIVKLRKAQYETLAAFRHALRRFMHFSETAAQAAGVTPQQHQALLAIKGFPGHERVTVGELAGRLQLRHHSAVGLIDRLVAEKLVARAPSREDRRKVLIELTQEGEQTLEKLSALHRRQLKRIGPELSRLLERLNEAGE
jgi:DNA-binding MarR family transcriptional regulator